MQCITSVQLCPYQAFREFTDDETDQIRAAIRTGGVRVIDSTLLYLFNSISSTGPVGGACGLSLQQVNARTGAEGIGNSSGDGGGKQGAAPGACSERDMAISPEEIYQEHVRWGDDMISSYKHLHLSASPNSKWPDRVIKIGYVSPDLVSNHPVARSVKSAHLRA